MIIDDAMGRAAAFPPKASGSPAPDRNVIVPTPETIFGEQ
jgi:hypothetical protein